MPSFAKKDGERWIREDEAIIDDPERESDYDSDSDYDNAIEFDPSEFEDLSTEDLSPEEEAEFELVAPNDFIIYKKNKAYRAAQSGSFTENIIKKESGGNYKAFNPAGGGWGAWGKYQIRGKANIKSIRNFANNPNLTKDDFLNNPKLQDDYYEKYWVPNVLAPGVNRIKRKGLSGKYTDDDLYSLVHLNGEQGTIDFLTGKRGDKHYSYNMSNSKYLRGQTGIDFEDLPVYQTFGQMQNPFNQFNTNGQSLYSGNGLSPFTFNKGHIGYSPVSQPLQPGVPAAYTAMDATKAWSNNTQTPYAPDNTQNTTVNTQGTGAFDAAMDIAGLANPVIGAIKKGAEIIDAAGERRWNFANSVFDATKDIKNLVAKTSSDGLAGATSIFSNLENDRLQRKSLKNMYKESIRDYYKTSFGFK